MGVAAKAVNQILRGNTIHLAAESGCPQRREDDTRRTG